MTSHRLSYMKTLAITAIVGVGLPLIVHSVASGKSGIAGRLIVMVGWSTGLLFAGVAMGAVTVLYRDHLRVTAQVDLYDAANDHRSAKTLMAARPDFGLRVRHVCRLVLRGRWLLVGDIVKIRPLDEIQATLDRSGCLDGLPFMDEMARFCGQEALVFRRVDKIYDYGRSKRLRRFERAVLLTGLRCDGSAHGGCQAACYLLWKEAWLKPATKDRFTRDRWSGTVSTAWREGAASTGPYTCQYTQLATASTPMAKWDIRQDFRPLVAGNVTVGAFCVAMLTRLFNAAQGLRGGTGHPGWEPRTTERAQPIGRELVRGDAIRVLTMEAIAPTLNEKGRNRGLWFDRDMIRHCGRRYAILGRVDRIIDDATGQMRALKTPSFILEGVEASGEFLRFCAQQEYPLWREVWLSRELDQPKRSFRQ